MQQDIPAAGSRVHAGQGQGGELPARLVVHPCARALKISQTWPWKEAFLACREWLCALHAPV